MEIATIKRGESFTFKVVLNAEYDMARLKEYYLYIGGRAMTGTVNGNAITVKLRSEDTDLMSGINKITLWLDDTILGVQKPYLGDMVVSMTNADESNSSVSEVDNALIPVTITATAITVGDIMYNYVKGDPFLYSDFTPEQLEALKVKGDPFLYSDFTPEQIVELQKPATDAATAVNEAEALRVTAETTRVENEQGRVTAEGLRVTAETTRQGNETDRQTAEGLRVTAETARQTNTGTAIQNANTATGLANNAATNANTKAGLADTAANNANGKATLANDAALLANEKAGLADAAATNADNARLAIANELALKVDKSAVKQTTGTSTTDMMSQKATSYYLSTANSFFDAGLGFSETPTEKTLNDAIKSIKLLGEWDKTKNYQIRYLSRNDTANQYTIWIRSVNDAGGNLNDGYYKGTLATVTEAGVGKYTKVVFPTDVNGRSVEAVIDYNLLTSPFYSMASVTSNHIIKPIFIGESISAVDAINRISISNSFYNAGFGFAEAANEKLVHIAIKSLKLIGNWDKNKNYQIRVLSRNDTTIKYSIWLRQVNDTGGTLIDAFYKGELPTVTEAGAGKSTKVVFPMDASGRSVEAVIDYNILPALISFASISINTTIKNTLINTPTFSDVNIADLFYNGKFGVTETQDVIDVVSAIKKIRLIGDGWDKSKQYVVSSLARNWSTTGYVITIRDNLGDGGFGSILYTGVLATVTEAGAGKLTKVLFPTDEAKKRSVEIIIDYNSLTNNKNYYFITGIYVNNNWVIRQEFIENVVSRDMLESNKVDFTYANELYHEPVLYAKPNIFKEVANIAFNKKGILSYRIDDNTIDDVFNATLERYGFRFTQYLNLANLPIEDYPNVRLMQMRGHEIGDHTPNHNTNFFTIPPGYLDFFTAYIGNGIDEITDGKAFLTRQFYNDAGVNVTNTTNPAVDMPTNKRGTLFSGTAGSNVLTGSFPQAIENSFLYVNNSVGAKIGWVKGSQGTLISIEMRKDDETPILLPSNDSNIEIYSIAFREAVSGTQARVTLDNQSTYLLFLASQLWAKVIGLEKLKTFAQPGGIWASLNRESIKYALDRLGMETASSWYGEIDFYYNNPDELANVLGVGINSENELYFDGRSYSYLNTAKNKILDRISLGKTASMINHHAYAYAQFDGADATAKKLNYRKFVYDLCQWLFEKKIKVIPMNELIKLTNAEVNPAVNIIPNLFTDLNAQGKPDGYTLGSGVTWEATGGRNEDKGRSLKRTGAGNIFTISDLGGLEKGENTFSIWIKGTSGNSVGVSFGSIGEEVFNIASTDVWQKFTVTIDIPHETLYMDIVGRVISGTGDTEISAMSLKK